MTYAREQAGLTKRALAAELHISEQLLCDIEAGRRNASPDLLERMAERLKCPLVVLQAKPPAESAETAEAVRRPETGAVVAP